MDFINKVTGNNPEGQNVQQVEKKEEGASWTDKVNGMLGGGKQGEAKEDYLDKGVDAFQEHVLGQGPQDNESAIEQAKDEQISDAIRSAYKGATGSDFPVKDKD